MPLPTPYPTPAAQVFEGQYCRLEPLNAARGDQLHEAITGPEAERLHRYLADPIPTSRADFDSWLIPKSASKDPMFFAVIDRATNPVEGRQSLMDIAPAHAPSCRAA